MKLIISCLRKEIIEIDDAQEGAEEDIENNNNEEIHGDAIETEDKENEEAVERPRKTSKFMTKYERARILGTRALQIRYCVKPEGHYFVTRVLVHL